MWSTAFYGVAGEEKCLPVVPLLYLRANAFLWKIIRPSVVVEVDLVTGAFILVLVVATLRDL